MRSKFRECGLGLPPKLNAGICLRRNIRITAICKCRTFFSRYNKRIREKYVKLQDLQEEGGNCILVPQSGYGPGCASIRNWVYRVAQIVAHFVALNTVKSSNIDQFSNWFHCQNQEIIAIIQTHLKWGYTSLWNVSVLKATTEYKTTSVTTHFKRVCRPAIMQTHWTFDVQKIYRMWQLL